MSSWAERVHRRAADFSNVVTSCGHPGSSAPTYPYRLEKVKFGIPLDEVCKNDNIPGPLLVLILKLNKESPNKRDVFRAPGHQGAMKKLIHFLQAGRLVNVDNYSVYTIASVLKKFLRKVPNGVFGRSGENELFAIIELNDEAEQNERLHKLFTSLPKYTQHLLVLLFGTFRVIASNAAHAGTGMTSEALGVSVAPSFFQSCVSDGKTARMEDVLKFKVATKIMKHIIDKFATHDLFGRENYEYYARVTGRILKVQDEWICSFQYPPPPRGKIAQQKYALQHSLEAEKTWLQCQCERWGLLAQEESRSTPALLTSSSSALDNSVVSLGVTPEHSFMESCARLSVSLEGPGLFALTSSPLPARNKHEFQPDDEDDDLDENKYNGGDDDDAANDDNDGDDDDDENNHYYHHNHHHHHRHHHHHNDHTRQYAEFANDLDISCHNDVENIENQSKNANFYLTSTSTTSTSGGKSRKTVKSRSSSNDQTTGRASGECTLTDSQDDMDGDEIMRSVVKRRYKQNKKKSPSTSNTAQIRGVQQQRRLRTSANNSKSLDVAPQQHTDFLNDYEFIGNPSISSSTLKVLTADTACKAPHSAQQKSRVCSRCKRGIRHASSCSSSTASGSAAANGANGSGMTMEELRAVNRYAESTKSLSYLPQVHERQTARMRTRSEWFLGPKDGDILCVIPNACSNCYLTVHNNEASPASYLGGGSTRDMRRVEHLSPGPSSATGQVEAVNTSLYLFYKQQQQQQPQYHNQRQSFHMSPDFMMDTDEGYMPPQRASTHSTTTTTTTSSSLHQHQTQPLLLTLTQQQRQQQHLTVGHSIGGTGGLYLDANYGIYDFDDKNILVTSTCCTTTTTTTTTTSTTDNGVFYYNSNSNNNNNNYKHEKHFNQENNNSYTLNNRQHLIKLSTKKDIITLSSPTTTTPTSYSQPQLSSTASLSSGLMTNKTPTTPTTKLHQQQHLHASPSKFSQHYRNVSQYFSTESLLSNHNVYLHNSNGGYYKEDDERPTCSSSTLTASKLSYHSPRQQQLDRSLDHSHLSDDISSSLLKSKNANISTTTTTNNASNTNCTSDDIEDDIDYVVATHYRHSTPMLQTRHMRQQALRRQRRPSTSSSLYQSFNASLQVPPDSTGGSPRNHHYTTSNTISSSPSSRQPSLYGSSRHETSSMSSSSGGGGNVGNIRLSNSAESVQFPVRRPSTRRILLGANIPRQYPLRSSLRRHKEKQIGTNTLPSCGSSSSSTTPSISASTGRPVSTSGGFISNSTLDAPITAPAAAISNESCIMDSSTTINFKAPRV